MAIADLKKKLHEYIDLAEEGQLEVLLHIAEGSIVQTGKYTDEEIAFFEKRMEDHLNGIGKTYTVEESFEKIRQNRNA